jgi:hypothetical protein
MLRSEVSACDQSGRSGVPVSRDFRRDGVDLPSIERGRGFLDAARET